MPGREAVLGAFGWQHGRIPGKKGVVTARPCSHVQGIYRYMLHTLEDYLASWWASLFTVFILRGRRVLRLKSQEEGGRSHNSVTSHNTHPQHKKTCSCGIKWCIYDALGLKTRIKILSVGRPWGNSWWFGPSSMSGQRRKSETTAPVVGRQQKTSCRAKSHKRRTIPIYSDRTMRT